MDPQPRRRGGPVTAAALRLEGPAPEQQLARDLARRAVPVAPVFVLVGAFGWGYAGALSAGYGVVLVVANFLLAAALISWAGPVPLGLTVVVTHLGLLIWETRYVSASLAFPVLKPRKGALR